MLGKKLSPLYVSPYRRVPAPAAALRKRLPPCRPHALPRRGSVATVTIPELKQSGPNMSQSVVRDLLITRRQEEDATGRLAELEEQFVQQLDETERYKLEVQALQQLIACFKQECDAKGITPDFPPGLEPHVQRLYGTTQAAAEPSAHAQPVAAPNQRPKDGCATLPLPPTPPAPHIPRPPAAMVVCISAPWLGLTRSLARGAPQAVVCPDVCAARGGQSPWMARWLYVGRWTLPGERHEDVGGADSCTEGGSYGPGLGAGVLGRRGLTMTTALHVTGWPSTIEPSVPTHAPKMRFP